jgi:hypothetical protein
MKRSLLPTQACRLIAALVLCALAAVAAPASAAEAAHGGQAVAKGGEAGHAAVQGLDPRVVSIAVLVAPVVDRGRLTGYLYLSVDLKATTEAGAGKIKDDLPLIQDAFLRALYAHPVEHRVAESQEVKNALAADLQAASAGPIDEASLESLEISSLVRVPL